MFGKKKENEVADMSSPVAPRSGSSQHHNSIVEGTMLEGTITADSDFRLDGEFKGTLNCNAKVIIGNNGNFNGTINCTNAVIEGRFDGKLNITEILHVREGALITGDVVTGKLVVQSGSVFDVNCKMTGFDESASTSYATVDDVMDSDEDEG